MIEADGKRNGNTNPLDYEVRARALGGACLGRQVRLGRPVRAAGTLPRRMRRTWQSWTPS